MFIFLQLVEVVQQKGRTQQEKDKFSSYITDMEKIIKLLLKLSGLLARAENALQSLPDNSSPSIKVRFYFHLLFVQKSFKSYKRIFDLIL